MDIEQLVNELIPNQDFIVFSGEGNNNSDKNSSFIFDGKKMIDKESTLTEMYSKLGLGEYLPYTNYDGLDELLQPSLWPELKAMSLQITNSEEFLTKTDRSVVANIFDIFRSTSEAWVAVQGRGSFVVELI